jgi:hypothetical protein
MGGQLDERRDRIREVGGINYDTKPSRTSTNEMGRDEPYLPDRDKIKIALQTATGTGAVHKAITKATDRILMIRDSITMGKVRQWDGGIESIRLQIIS